MQPRMSQAHPENGKATDENQSQDKAEISLNGKLTNENQLKVHFKNTLIPKINAYFNKNNKETTKNVVELHYFLCWGYTTDDKLANFILEEKETIENFISFVEQENKSKANSYLYDLKIHLSPNENNTQMVESCNSAAQPLLENLKTHNQIINQATWRASQAWETASKSFDKYYTIEKTRLDELLKTDAENFVEKHTDYSQEDSINHYINETKDILALLTPTLANDHAPHKQSNENNTFVFLFSRHGLCKIMNQVLANRENLGYKQDNFHHTNKLPVVKKTLSNDAAIQNHTIFGTNNNKGNPKATEIAIESPKNPPILIRKNSTDTLNQVSTDAFYCTIAGIFANATLRDTSLKPKEKGQMFASFTIELANQRKNQKCF